MALKLKIIEDTVLKQKPIDSSQLADNDKQSIPKGTELELHSWAFLEEDNAHVRVAFAQDSFKGRNTWLVFKGHVQILEGDRMVLLEPPPVVPIISLMVREVTSCSTFIVRGLDMQIIAEMNILIPNVLVSFEDLNVRLEPAVWPLLQLPAKRGLERAIQERGIQMQINSAYRTIAQQLILFNHFQNGRCGISLAARPPRSNHQSGLAIDVSDNQGWRPFLERWGWRWLGPDDPVHFDFVGGGTRDIRPIAVRAFQRIWNKHNISDRLVIDGAYGAQTERRLNNSPVEGFDISVLGFRVLRLSRPFMQGEDVRLVQQALVNAGFPVEVDGIYGPGTQTVIRLFQTRQGLVADGIVGPATLAELGI